MLLAWTGSSSSSLDALNFRHGLASYVFLAFRILLVSRLIVDVLVMMTSRFWGIIDVEF